MDYELRIIVEKVAISSQEVIKRDTITSYDIQYSKTTPISHNAFKIRAKGAVWYNDNPEMPDSWLPTLWSWPHDSGHMWEARSPHPSRLERSLVRGSSQALACLTFSLPCS